MRNKYFLFLSFGFTYEKKKKKNLLKNIIKKYGIVPKETNKTS